MVCILDELLGGLVKLGGLAALHPARFRFIYRSLSPVVSYRTMCLYLSSPCCLLIK